MMKKVLMITFLSAMTLVSCKKNYTCSCTFTHFSSLGTNTTTYTKKINEATKKQAGYLCNEAKITRFDGDQSYTEECKLSK